MSTVGTLDQTKPDWQLGKSWGWFVALGVVLIVLGIIAIGSEFVATLLSVMVFASLLLIGGVAQIVNAFFARCWGYCLLHILAGILYIVVGAMMLEDPLRAIVQLTLILAVAFIVGGLVRVFFVLFQRFAGWPWVLLNGIVELLLGIMIWRQWPEASLWVIGMFVGIDLIFSGWSWVMLGLGVKSVRSAITAPRPA